MKKYIYWALLVFPLFVWSCSDVKDIPEPSDEVSNLIEVKEIGKKSRAEIIEMGQKAFGPGALALGFLLQYDVKFYKVVYKTQTPEGKEVIASGALMLPDNGGSFPMVGYQHGTIFNEADAPSYFKEGAEDLIGFALASAGYLTAVPDYVGYGESKSEPHPYEHALGLAIPNTDMFLAVKDYFNKERINWNNNLLLCGYSAGGYATLATQKYIEENYKSTFNLKASIAGAGAYNKSLVLDDLINKPSGGEVDHNRSYVWVVQTYNRIYQLNKPMSYFFKEPYALQIEQEGHLVTLSGSIHNFLNPDFVKSYKNGNEEEIINVFKDNDLVDWKTNINTVLIHGDADTYVPYVNATTALEGMKNAGSPNVQLKTVSGGTHTSSIQDFILETYTLFSNNRI